MKIDLKGREIIYLNPPTPQKKNLKSEVKLEEKIEIEHSSMTSRTLYQI